MLILYVINSGKDIGLVCIPCYSSINKKIIKMQRSLLLFVLVIKLVCGFRLPSSSLSSSINIKHNSHHLLYNNKEQIENDEIEIDTTSPPRSHSIMNHLNSIITNVKKTIVTTILMGSSLNIPLRQRQAILGGTRYMINSIKIIFHHYHYY